MFSARALKVSMVTDQARIRGWIVISLLIVAGLASRLLFQSTILNHWDSVNFALALDEFDLHLHQPHPPGMFVFYILLGRLLNFFIQDANKSLVMISVVTSGLSVPAIYILGSTLFDRRIGLIAAAVTLTSPLVWFHGEVALTYMFEFLWVVLIVLACFTARSGNKGALFVSAFLVGAAGGIRPNTSIFIFPLWLASVGWAVWERKYSIRNVAVALAIMAASVAMWAVPLVIMAGGPLEYWDTLLWWRAQHMEDSGSVEGLTVNLARLVMFSLYALGIGLIPVAWSTFREWKVLLNKLRHHWPTQLLALWMAPAVAYFILIHLRQQGHTFTIVPAFIIVTSVAIVSFSRALSRFNENAWAIVTVVVVMGNGLFFLFGPSYLFGDSRLIFNTPTWTSIREYDTFVKSRLEVIHQNFSPTETVVLAGSRNFRLPDFYLSMYPSTELSYRLNENGTALPGYVRTLVLFDDMVFPGLSSESSGYKTLPLPKGKQLRYITWEPNQQVTVTSSTFEITDSPDKR